MISISRVPYTHPIVSNIRERIAMEFGAGDLLVLGLLFSSSFSGYFMIRITYH